MTIDGSDDLGHRLLVYRARPQVYGLDVVTPIGENRAVEPLVAGKTVRADVARDAG